MKSKIILCLTIIVTLALFNSCGSSISVKHTVSYSKTKKEKYKSVFTFSKDNLKVISLVFKKQTSDFNSIRIYDMKTQKSKRVTLQYKGNITSAEFSKFGKFLAISDQKSKKTLIIETSSGKLLNTVEYSDQLKFSNNNKFLALFKVAKNKPTDKEKYWMIVIYDLSSGKAIKTIDTLKKDYNPPSAFIFSKDDKTILVSFYLSSRFTRAKQQLNHIASLYRFQHSAWKKNLLYEYAINGWNISSGEQTLKLEGHLSPITSMTFPSKSDNLYSVGYKNVKIWNIKKESIIKNMSFKYEVKNIYTSASGNSILVKSGNFYKYDNIFKNSPTFFYNVIENASSEFIYNDVKYANGLPSLHTEVSIDGKYIGIFTQVSRYVMELGFEGNASELLIWESK